MGIIQINLPPKSPYTFGPAVLHDMEADQELLRQLLGTVILLTADAAIDLGIAWGRGNTPPVKLRFQAMPGRIYHLFWMTNTFGAGMGVQETAE